MTLAAGNDLVLQIFSVVVIGGGFAGCGLLWYAMVVKGGREERRRAEEEAARRNAAASPQDENA